MPVNPTPDAEQFKGRKSGVRRILKAIGYSIDGIKAAVEEAGFRELLCLHGALSAVSLHPQNAVGLRLRPLARG